MPKRLEKFEIKNMYRHTPVMLEEAMSYLNPQPGEIFVDATLGGGGYTFELAKHVGPTGKVIAIDLDETAINHAKLKTVREGQKNVSIYHANFRDIESIVEEEFAGSPSARLSGIVFDLGLSSAQLEDPLRGFSFLEDAPLSMAFGSLIDEKRTEAIVNITPVAELTNILRDFGEERFARSIARSIVETRKLDPIKTTKELVGAIQRGIPVRFRHSRLHFATRTFQALRIATNQELTNLEKALNSLKSLLKENGRIVVISFHSLEDRIVKHFFKREATDCICSPEAPICQCNHKAWLQIVTKKAVRPTIEEINNNPRARSAKLRAAKTKTNDI